MLRIARDVPEFEDEWDPQGLNSLNKDELESFSDDEEENAGSEEALKAAWDVDEDEESDDLDRDGLTELEEMERNLLQEQSILDFAMVGDEE